MFVGLFKLTSDGLPAILRIDLLDEGQTGLYEVIDQDGISHVWRWSLSDDEDSESLDQRAWYAMWVYLAGCLERGWTGTMEPVMLATGIDIRSFSYLVNVWNVEHSSQKPEGIMLQ
jgi:hypothetical protein